LGQWKSDSLCQERGFLGKDEKPSEKKIGTAGQAKGAMGRISSLRPKRGGTTTGNTV